MGFDALAPAACCALPVLLSLLAVRVAYVLCRSGCPPSRPSAAAGVRSLIVLGSGGHTAEMMNIITALQKDRFMPRYYVAALTDNMSLQKAQAYEQSLVQLQSDKEKILRNGQFMQIYRSREVGQSYITSIATTLLAMLHAMWLIIRIRPQAIFCNGPGTCIPLCISAFLLKEPGGQFWHKSDHHNYLCPNFKSKCISFKLFWVAAFFFVGAWFAMVLDFLH